MKRDLRRAVEANRGADHAQSAIGIELQIPNPVQAFGVLLSQLGKDDGADTRESHLATVGVAGEL